MKTYLILVALMVATASTNAAISAGQKLQLNFTDGWVGTGNWNVYTNVNSGFNIKTGNDTDMIDSLGNTVTNVSLTATNWFLSNWNGGVEWIGNDLEEVAQDQTSNFWWANGSAGTNESITISGLDTGLYYNVKLYALNPLEVGTGSLTVITLNGNVKNGNRQGDRWNSTTTPFTWSSIATTASGSLEFIIDAQLPDNPVINAIVIEAVTNPPPASIVVGQWLQINFTDGWYVNAAGSGGAVPHGGGGLRNWNYMNDWSNPSYNASTAGSGLIDSQGNTVAGVSMSASGWMGGSWSGGAVWGGNGIEAAGPDGLSGNHLMQTDETINFWWGFNSEETVTIHGLDTGLSYNVKLYSINNGSGNSGETTTVDLNGSTTASFTELDRWGSTTTPYVWTGVSATGAGDLVFSINSTVTDNPVLNAIVIEAVTGVIPEIGNIMVEQLPGTNGLVLTWSSASGFNYVLQSKLSLQDINWATNTMVLGTGGDVTVTTAVDQVHSFYRVVGE